MKEQIRDFILENKITLINLFKQNIAGVVGGTIYAIASYAILIIFLREALDNEIIIGNEAVEIILGIPVLPGMAVFAVLASTLNALPMIIPFLASLFFWGAIGIFTQFHIRKILHKTKD